MDLVSFIPGVGSTQNFTAGVNTPAAYVGPNIGMTDGTSVATASKNMAEVYNRILLQIAATIQGAGLTIDNTNWAQLLAAVQTIANTAASTAVSNVLTLNNTNVFVGQSSGSTAGVVLPNYGTWKGIWVDVINTQTSIFTAAGGTTIAGGIGATTVHLFATRIA
jgi:hypothetical protein